MSDDVRARAEAWAASEVDAYPGVTLDERIRSWMHGGVHPDDVARFVVDGYEAGHRAALAVAPATGDAAAVGIAGLDFHVPRDRTPSGYTRVEAYMGNGHVVVMGSPSDESHSCDALGCGSTGAHVIARLPLPAPATAVEEARKAVIEKAKRWRDMDDENDDAGCVELSEAVDALLAAEAEAAATHAAKGGNCG